MGPRNDKMRRSGTPESKPGSSESAVLGRSTPVSPSPRQTFIYSGFVDQFSIGRNVARYAAIFSSRYS